MVRGAYHFARPEASSAVQQADRFLKFVNPTEPTDLLVLDLEASDLTAAQTCAWANAFGDRLRAQSGYSPVLYCGGYMKLNSYRTLKDHFDTWWYPRYPIGTARTSWPTSFNPTLPSPNVWGRLPDFWQFSGNWTGNGPAWDANLFDGTVTDLRALNKGKAARPTRYPGAIYKPLGTQTQPRMARYDIFCFHTMVGSLAGTHDMFSKNGYGGTESHYGVGGIWGGDANTSNDGVAYQWQDLAYTADANLDGNPRIISVETADNAKIPIAPWTAKQLETLIDMAVWHCITYDIPPVLIPDTKPGRRGIGYHAQGIPPNLVSGGERWSSADGKVCPDTARIRQLKEIIIPEVYRRVNGLAPVEPVEIEDDDMPFIAENSGRYFLISGNYKSLIDDEDQKDRLIAKGFRYVGSMAGVDLAFWRDSEQSASLLGQIPSRASAGALAAVAADTQAIRQAVTAEPAEGSTEA